ncbi:hypothetical protein [Ammoniphilus oxalaticus]|nr:hypothetical protein [Ammoniphilus oxalaticus]
MSLGIFDLDHRLEQMKRLLREKLRLKELIEDDIRELEKDLKELKKMLN